MNIEFGTLCMISVPGFLIGIMTGRFTKGRRWQRIKKSLKVGGNIISGLFLLVYFFLALVILGIMAVYLLNLPDTVNPLNFWIVLILGVWMLVSLCFELRDLFGHPD